MGLPGGMEMVIIFIAVLLLFGAKKLPELARGIGKAMGEFKSARQEFEDEIRRAEYSVKEEPRHKRLATNPEPMPTPASTVEHSAAEDDAYHEGEYAEDPHHAEHDTADTKTETEKV